MIVRDSFGRTGHQSSRVIFGSAGLGSVGQTRADEVLAVLRQFGVNHIDTAADYGDAELRVAPWLAAHPGEFFIATKTGERTADRARQNLERSLEQLGLDHIDLIQLHNLVEDDEWEVAHGPGGALEALVRAREEGLVSFIGVTGHGLRIARMHLRSLERFDFDTVLLPYNYLLLQNDTYRADLEQLLQVCEERNVAVQTIKAIARRRWPRDDRNTYERETERLSWYEPLTEERAISNAVEYVLGRENRFLISSSDFRILPATLAAAERVSGPPSDEVLLADAETQQMSPLFDGHELERI